MSRDKTPLHLLCGIGYVYSRQERISRNWKTYVHETIIVILLIKHVFVNSRMGSWCSLLSHSVSTRPLCKNMNMQHAYLRYRTQSRGFSNYTYVPTFLSAGGYTPGAVGDILNWRTKSTSCATTPTHTKQTTSNTTLPSSSPLQNLEQYPQILWPRSVWPPGAD